MQWPNLHNPRMKMAGPMERDEPIYKVLVIGEAPGKTEDEEGVPFVGKTGQFLRQHIPPEWKTKLYFQNVARCRPPENRAPTDREVLCCSKYLNEDILALKPHAILGIGGEALSYFWPKTTPMVISRIRGVPFPFIVGDHVGWFMGTFHPSFVLRAEREAYGDSQIGVNPVLPVFRNDIKSFFKRLPKFSVPPKITLPPKDIIYPKTKDEALGLFYRLKEPFGVDYETIRLKPYMRDARLICAGFSDGDITFSFPVDWPGRFNPWGLEVFRTMMTSGRHWIAQNAGFELAWTIGLTNCYDQKFEDTEAAARLIHQRKGLGSLDVLSRIYFGYDIKEVTNNSLAGQGLGPLDKQRLAEYSVKTVLEYNALDAWVEVLLFYKLMDMLEEDQFSNYTEIIETIRSTIAMEVNGLTPDLVESAKLQKVLFTKGQEQERKAHAFSEVKEYEKREGKLFSLGSPKAVGRIITEYCKIPLPKTDKGVYITDEEILSKISDQHPLISCVLDFREVEKLKGTYVEPILNQDITGADGLIHGAYTTVRTATYRLSSNDPNMQNFPKRKHREVRRQIIPKPGHIFVAFDYGQLEARTLVMASKDAILKRAFLNNEDIHMKWLLRLIEIYPAYMDRLRDKTGENEEGALLKAGRDTIKTDFVFAAFYGSVAKSIAHRANMSLNIAERVLGEFWQEYRGVKKWTNNQFAEYNETGTVRSLNNRIRNEVISGNEPINSAIQGTAAEIVLAAQNALYHKAMNEDIYFLPRISIHDDLVFELPSNNDLETYIKIIGEEIVKPRYPFVNLPLVTECRCGPNWADLEKIALFKGTYF